MTNKITPFIKIKEIREYYISNKDNIVIPSKILSILKDNKAWNKNNTSVLLSQLIISLINADPDSLGKSSDLYLHVWKLPAFYMKAKGGIVRDERFPIITADLMNEIYNILVPESIKKNIIKNKLEGNTGIDEDFAFELIPNSNFDYIHAMNTVKNNEGKNNQYDSFVNDPQYLINTDSSQIFNNVSRFRCNFSKANGDYVFVIRPIESEIPDFFDLGLNVKLLNVIQRGKGIVFVTGPTGSGKSTTLASLINEINKTQQKHILTIENPVEYIHVDKQSLFTQRDVPTDSDNFIKSAKSALRQHPDIVVIGEMRDTETIRLALELSETGHLVFSTLHTLNAAKTIDRIINSFPAEEQNQIALSLKTSFAGSISQLLVKTKEGGIMAINEYVSGTDGVKKAIGEMKSQNIAQSVNNDAQSHISLINACVNAIKDGKVDQNEIFSKIYYEDIETYNLIVKKLQSLNIYDEDSDNYTERNIEKKEREFQNEIKSRAGIKENDISKQGLSEAGQIEHDIKTGMNY